MAADPLLNRRYKLVSPLGAGGMALVHKGQDLSLGRLVAIKILRETLIHDPEFLARFQQEARAAANLAHPNIVTVHDYGHDNGRYYIVMEYIEGKDLKALVKEGAPFPVDQALDLAIQVCAGIGYAHRAGLVHCDVKPQNILVTPDGRVKITDFGIARALASLVPGETTDVVWGSPQYYSPEQAAGESPTPASDVYSIGVVLYEMLAGRLPFVASTQPALAMMHLREEPPLLSLFNPGVPHTLERIIHKVMAKEPSARYRTADQLGRILISYRERGEEMTAAQDAARARGPARVQTPGPNYGLDGGDALEGATPPGAQAHRLPPDPLAEVLPESPTVYRPAGRAGEQAPYGATVHSDEASLAAGYGGAEGGLDWVAVALTFLAVVAVLGLVPLWVWVYLVYTR